MVRESDERRKDTIEQDEATGATSGRKGRSSVTNETSIEGANPDKQKEIQITLVDDMLNAERQEQHTDDRVAPDTTTTGVDPECKIVSETTFEVSKIGQEIDQIVGPQENLEISSARFEVPLAENPNVESITHSSITTVTPNQELEKEEELQVVTVRDVEVERTSRTLSNKMTPTQNRSLGRESVEIDDEDPVFDWTGGTPYSSGRPKLVIHRSPENVTTLPFLQILLRDTYTEIEGGEPGAETVGFVANEPRIPQIQKNIVTLDLTGDAWQSDTRGEKPVIERNDVDIVPKLREVASTLYTGELGYFVVNAPDEWEGDVIQEKFFDTLVERVAEATVPERSEEEGFFEMLRSSPVVVAEPTVEEESELFGSATRYFSLNDDGDQFSSVDQIEEAKEQALRRDDWKRIALTRRQDSDVESDEHYFWKAAIAEGLAWEMKLCHETQQRANEDDEPFETFLKREILANGVIETEARLGASSGVDGGVSPDIFVESLRPSWVEAGITDFVETNTDIRRQVVVEFETGRREGAFNFRKIQETLEKYADAGIERTSIYLVLPSRVFFRGEKRARMILDLVESWDEVEDGNRLSAEAFVPVLIDGYCRGLKPADRFVDDLYRGGEE